MSDEAFFCGTTPYVAELEFTIRKEHTGTLQHPIPALVTVRCKCGRHVTRMVGDWDEERAWRLHEIHVQAMVDKVFGTGLRS